MREVEAAPPRSLFTTILGAVRRFYWVVIAMTCVGLYGGLSARKFTAPVYEASGTIWLSEDMRSQDRMGPSRGGELMNAAGWSDLLKSFAVVDQVVRDTKQYVVPYTPEAAHMLVDFTADSAPMTGSYTVTTDTSGDRYTLRRDEVLVERGAVGDSIGKDLGFHWAPPRGLIPADHTISFDVITTRQAAVSLIDRLDVAVPERSSFIKVSLRGPSPEQTEKVLNSWINHFVRTAAEMQNVSLRETVSILERQLADAQKTMRSAESSFGNFQSSTITLPSASPGAGAADPVMSRYFQDKLDRDALEQDVQTLESILQEAKRPGGELAVEEILRIPSLSNGAFMLRSTIRELAAVDSTLSVMRQTMTDQNPAVTKVIAQEKKLRNVTVPLHANEQLRAMKKLLASLNSRVDKSGKELQQSPQRLIEGDRKKRDLSAASDLYTTLYNKYTAATLAMQSAIPSVRVLDRAAARREPARRTGPLVVALGTFGGLGAGVLIALLLVKTDRRFRYPEQVATVLKMDIIGATPAVASISGRNADHEAAAFSIEAFRTLRLSLHHAFPEPPVMLTLSSPGAGEGKSVVAGNLALSFAEAGYRTLLIDGDVRRGRLDATFGVDRRPGLVDCLSGAVPLDDVIRPTAANENLAIIPSGTRTHAAPELLTSAALPRTLEALALRYDVILVDSPPLAAGIDAYALAVATGNLITVVRTGVTSLETAKTKMKLVRKLPIRVLGAIINDLGASNAYTEYSYLADYGIADEVALPPGGAESKAVIPTVKS
jgi:polysaccharide biosynthesis transport protein